MKKKKSEKIIKIKPCPFCGYKNPEFIDESKFHYHAIYCPKCEAEGSPGETPQQCTELWNTRKK